MHLLLLQCLHPTRRSGHWESRVRRFGGGLARSDFARDPGGHFVHRRGNDVQAQRVIHLLRHFRAAQGFLHVTTGLVLDPYFSATKIVHLLETIPGLVPSLHNLPKGCRFMDRCTRAKPETCSKAQPALETVGPGHRAACYFPFLEARGEA